MRDYAPLLAAAKPGMNRVVAMRHFLDLSWQTFGDDAPTADRKTISWIGFYERDAANPEQMLLIDREPKPACSPIGLHGMCGRGMVENNSIIIDNVRTLGANYIACDPRDQSELVVPLVDAKGTCFGVLDIDSYAVAAFDEHDAAQMHKLLVAFGLTLPPSPRITRR
jgi:putative methionine-R-sulfoxide reductase with GAF domain